MPLGSAEQICTLASESTTRRTSTWFTAFLLSQGQTRDFISLQRGDFLSTTSKTDKNHDAKHWKQCEELVGRRCVL